ncbi:Thioredoxin-related protein DsbJ [Chlamydiales bacterium SCGC AG-110-P3]|nr:Thioredoxin-related protein DsbJ [Chlamydiales bacterium SCGC AG-110-P3]
MKDLVHMTLNRLIPLLACLTISWTATTHAEGREFIQWLDSYENATNQSEKTNRPIVVLFTGSDWCGWCKKLEKEVFNTREFADRASNKFVFLMLDFPMHTRQSTAQKAHNEKLKKQFGVRGFPTVILLDEKQQKITSTGYQAGGGKKYADYLLKVVADYESYKGKQERAAANALNPEELQELYQQARELCQDDDIDAIVKQGLESKSPGFFLKERYLKLVSEGMIHSDEAQAVKARLLSIDPENKAGHHRRLAVIEFQRLAEELEVTEGDAWTACKPLLEYIDRFGQQDKDNLWRLQMTVAQTLLNKDHVDEALAYAKYSYDTAPIPVKETIAQAILQIEHIKRHQ